MKGAGAVAIPKELFNELFNVVMTISCRRLCLSRDSRIPQLLYKSTVPVWMNSISFRTWYFCHLP
jgi:hypothetical protein